MASSESPQNSKLSLWILSLVAVAGTAMFGLPRLGEQMATKPSAQPTRDTAKAVSTSASDSFDPLDVLHDHLRVEAHKPENTSQLHLQLTLEGPRSSGSTTTDLKVVSPSEKPLSYYLGLDPARYEFLIAAVPDPVETKFPHEFDEVVDGIQRAFEAQQFTLRANRMPWPHQSSQTGKQTDAQRPPMARDVPGVLLFRLNRDTAPGKNPLLPCIALVFLVGESPISGIHKPALIRALQLRKELNKAIRETPGACWNCEDAPIPIIGPYFSGSQASLAAALAWWRTKESLPIGIGPYLTGPQMATDTALTWWKRVENDRSIRIITGNASAVQSNLFKGPAYPALEQSVSVQATVIPNELLVYGVLRYLGGDRGTSLLPGNSENWKIPHRVAFLRETNTGFGTLAISNQSSPSGLLKEVIDPPVLDMPFPMSISQLEVDQNQNLKPILPQTGFVEPRLPFRDLTQLDALPPYDPQTATATAGEGIREILERINRARVRYVGIVATDNRDVVFLTRLLRKSCPNVRVFTTEPSVALLHPEDASTLRGMLVGATYPMSTIVQGWTRQPTRPEQSRQEVKRTIPFPTQGSQGYHNAVLVHFQHKELMVGYHPPSLPGMSDCRKPPIWIGEICQGGQIVPVHCFTDYLEENFTPVIEPACARLDSPQIVIPSGVLLGSLLAIVALAVVILALFCPQVWNRWLADLTRPDRAVDSPLFLSWVWFCRGLMLAGILLFALPFATPAREALGSSCPFPNDGVQWRHWFAVGAAIGLVVETIVILVLLLRRALGVCAKYPHESRGGYWALTLLVVLAGLLLGWRESQPPVIHFFLYVRATELSSGLSPLLPMGLLGTAAFVLGLCCLRQANQCRHTWLKCPYPRIWSGVMEADRELRKEFRNPVYFLCDLRYLGVTLGLAIPLLLFCLWDVFVVSLPSGEGRAWDGFMQLAFWILIALVVLILARFLVLWSRLEKLLEEILRVPMVAAFERLPHEIGRLFGGYLFSPRPSHRTIATAAWALPAQARKELAEEIARSRPTLEWVFGRPEPTSRPNSGQEDRPDINWLANRLRRKAAQYLHELPREWQNQSVDDAFGREHPPEPQPEPPSAAYRRPTLAEKENFIAAFVVFYLANYFVQLRMLVYALAGASLLLLVTAAGYTFQPETPRIHALLGLFATVAGGIVFVLYKINRNGLLSRILRTTPNRFTPDAGFLSSVAQFVLPVVTVVLLQLFGLFRFIMEPILGLFQ
jgi:hypothetical protein